MRRGSLHRPNGSMTGPLRSPVPSENPLRTAHFRPCPYAYGRSGSRKILQIFKLSRFVVGANWRYRHSPVPERRHPVACAGWPPSSTVRLQPRADDGGEIRLDASHPAVRRVLAERGKGSAPGSWQRREVAQSRSSNSTKRWRASRNSRKAWAGSMIVSLRPPTSSVIFRKRPR